MKRSNVWRDPQGELWERRHGGVDVGMDYGIPFHLYADGRASYGRRFFTPNPDSYLRDAWEILIGAPLPIPATEAQSEPPKKRPRVYQHSDGTDWTRGFRRGEVLTEIAGGWIRRGLEDDESARAAIAALWPERPTK